MLQLKHLFFALIFLFNFKSTHACTWDEPWQKEILEKADHFVLATIQINDSTGVHLQIIKNIGKEKLHGLIELESPFSHTSSSSGHGSHFNFHEGDTGYFFLRKVDDNLYSIPTPSSAFAKLNSTGKVYATYRHSYHQAVVPQQIFEKTYSQIWSYYKYKTYEKDSILPFINEYIDLPRAGFAESEIDVFFKQHVALETAYLLDITVDLTRIQKFISEENFHSTVSALQLLSHTNTEASKSFLFEYIKEKDNENFQKVIAIWAFAKHANKKEIRKLKRLKSRLSDDEQGFGGNIMDPRVGTRFPSPKRAVDEL